MCPPAPPPRFLTDLELACKTKAFDVHKLVISSISQYFREILAKDPGMKRLELPSLSPLGTPFNCRCYLSILSRDGSDLFMHDFVFINFLSQTAKIRNLCFTF